MAEQEEIMDDDYKNIPLDVVADAMKKEIKDVYYRLLCETIKGYDSNVMYLSAGINVREFTSYMGSFCIALIECGSGMLGSPEYGSRGLLFIHPVTVFNDYYKDETPSGDIIQELAYGVVTFIMGQLEKDGITENIPYIHSAKGYSGCDVYRKSPVKKIRYYL
jgi:hypothetical protein